MARKHNYRRLEPDKLVSTIEDLQKRIAHHLGERGLTRICGELATVARDARTRVARLQRPNWSLRLIPIAAAGVVAYLTMMVTSSLGQVEANIDAVLAKHLMVLKEDVQGVMRAVRKLLSDLTIPIALAVPVPLVLGMFAFIWTLESRWKRRHVLRYLHELRSIIHVIDMHQLTKDPHHPSDPGDPDHVAGEKLMRYLDYCSELLSLSAKVAALYAESSHDPVVISTVSDLGQITSNLSNKIWQKLNIVEKNLPGTAAA